MGGIVPSNALRVGQTAEKAQSALSTFYDLALRFAGARLRASFVSQISGASRLRLPIRDGSRLTYKRVSSPPATLVSQHLKPFVRTK